MKAIRLEQMYRQGFVMVVLVSAFAVMTTTDLLAAPPSDGRMATAPLPIGKELALTGEVVMIEGNVQIVEDPVGGKKDAYLVMENLYVAQVAGDEAIQFHVNEKTRMDENLKVGDKVEVLAAKNGEARSIKKTE